mmetsp:Transcript_41428/g.119292  ORF Transcript_41428/g.119292 Transcript_41428/m.119292 type:complete len:371 (-) Transcript_41428:62-1174(-)
MALRTLPMILAAIAGSASCAPSCDAAASCAQEEEETMLLQVGWPRGDEEIYDDETGDRGHVRVAGGDGSLCGIKGFSPYAGYKGDLRVAGKLWVKMFSGASAATAGQVFTFRLSGVDEKCSGGPGSSPNSCGVQIHEAKSCSRATGGHHWNKKELRRDPWAAMTYTSTQDSTGKIVAGAVREPVTTGLTGKDIDGRTVVVHDFLGAPIACAELEGFAKGNPPKTKMLDGVSVTNFVSVMGFRSPVDGSVTLNEKPGLTDATTGVYMTYSLKGVDARCSQGPGDAENSCGVRLHEGTSCRSAGDHLFNGKALSSNPWSQVSYVSAKSKKHGLVAETAEEGVNLGLSMKEISGRVLLVYDFVGKPMGCGTVG